MHWLIDAGGIEKMKILLNLLPLKTGGGVQVALDFLNNIKNHGNNHEWHVICRKEMPFIKLCEGNIKLAATVSDNLLSRIKYEWITHVSVANKIQPKVALTLFGPHMRVNSAVNIGGCAYSNLFYPEINFWKDVPIQKRWIKRLIDHFRKSRLAKNDISVFETEELASRAKQIMQSGKKTICIKPSCSNLVTIGSYHTPTREQCKSIPAGFKITLISGYHPNKNIEFLGRVAIELKKMNALDICFVLTLPTTNPNVSRFLSSICAQGLSKYFHNLGPIPQAGCAEVYRACNAAVLPSNLESFSNMIAESWAMNRPLFISEQSWATSICHDAALYYKHLDAKDLAEKILSLKNGETDYQLYIEKGMNQLAKYPDSRERFEQYLELIETAATNGNGSPSQAHPQQLKKVARPL
jgi:glycosyltransferase involved in cell wall biosynthesis